MAKLTHSEIARRIGVSRERVRQLRARGDSDAAILAGTYRRQGPQVQPDSLSGQCRAHGVSPHTYRNRLLRGYSHEAALTGIGVRPRGRPRKVV